jgi:hypothetical protein
VADAIERLAAIKYVKAQVYFHQVGAMQSDCHSEFLYINPAVFCDLNLKGRKGAREAAGAEYGDKV